MHRLGGLTNDALDVLTDSLSFVGSETAQRLNFWLSTNVEK